VVLVGGVVVPVMGISLGEIRRRWRRRRMKEGRNEGEKGCGECYGYLAVV